MFEKKDIEKYYVAEKSAGKNYIIFGLVGVVVGTVLFFIERNSFYFGASLPPLLLGLYLMYSGYNAFKKSDERRKRNVYDYDMNPQNLRNKELPRMMKVLKVRKSNLWALVFLLVFGIALYFRFYVVCEGDACRFSFFRKGLGLTLMIISLLALLINYLDEKRVKEYVKGLKVFSTLTGYPVK
ncbi:MAG: hypothetical protein JST23_05440 [Bacteroidetes bacterium]|nr:hypothetical protein [Bacteroidota bacterium]